MKISAVIFDLNGTILEDEDEYGRAYNKVLKSLGVETKDEPPQVKGIGVKENWPVLIKRFDIKTTKSPEVLAHETQEAYLLEIGNITVRDGFTEFYENLKDSGIEIALATSNTWETIEKVLNKVGLQGIFETVTTIDEVVYGKPDPSLFIITADKLGVEREGCLVIEDAPSGITAAKLAGMKVIAITDKDEDAEILENADLVVDGFNEITPKLITDLGEI
jgi:HAD superfamily hydrolase (TIGR01509 family)